jgi:hypothetical protein
MPSETAETQARETPRKIILAVPTYLDNQTLADAINILGHEVSRPGTREELLRYSKDHHSHCIMTSDYEVQDPRDITPVREVREHFKGKLLVFANSSEAKDYARKEGLHFVTTRKELWDGLRTFLSS